MVEREQASMNSSTTTSTTRSDQRQITVDIISRAIREMYASGPVAFVRDASLHQKIFLACVVQRLRKSGLSDVTLAEVRRMHV
jgi:Cdc6-like AAA superfamily ATPase